MRRVPSIPDRFAFARPALIAVSMALALALGACASTRGDARADAPTAERMAPSALPSGIALMSPRPGLFTAGQPAAQDWSALAAAGVRTVVNLRTADELQGRDERAEVEAAGLRYLEIPIANAAAIDAENAARLSAALAGADGPVLVHCASGNRVGGLLAVAMARNGMSEDEALAFGRSAGMKSSETRAREVFAQERARQCAAGTVPQETQCAAP